MKTIKYILKYIDSILGFIEYNDSKLSNEHINNYAQISIIYKLLKCIIKYGEKIDFIYNEKKLSDPELLDNKQLEWPILRLQLLNNLLVDNNNFPQYLKREFSSSTNEEEDEYKKNQFPITTLKLIAEMVNNKEDINSFIKLIKYMHENIKSIK